MDGNSNRQRRGAVTGASVVAAAVGVVVGLAAAEHAQAREENRESVVEGIGRWIRETVFDAPRSANPGPATANGRFRSRMDINALPVRRITDAEAVTSNSSARSAPSDQEKAFCAVCRDHYDAGDQLMRLPCFHEFHSECVREYLESSECPLCPLCRHPVSLS